MIRSLFSRPLLGCSLAIITAALPLARTEQLPARQQLVRDFIEVLNSKDTSKIQAFLERRGAPGSPPAERAKRLVSIAEQGAPFTLVRFGSDQPDRVLALTNDRNGIPVTFQIETVGDDPKLGAMRIVPGDNTDAKPPKDYRGWTSLSALVEQVRKDTDCPALGVTVVRNGKPETAVSGIRTVGSPTPVGPQDPWSVGSIGKSLCSTVIGKLIEQGKLRWDTTLAEALPSTPMNPKYRSVTIEQLMHHRGGLPQDMGFRRADVERISGDAKTPRELRRTYIRDVLAREPIAPPDTRFAYSNAGYSLLAFIAEERLNLPYEEVLRKWVFRPLGLRHSYVGIETLPKDRPMGHVVQGAQLQPVMMRGPLESMMAGAGGGIYMSLEDLAKYGAMHLAGLRGKDGLLKASTVARLHRGIPEDSSANRLYACGWSIETFPGLETAHGHNGSNGTFRAEIALFPKSNLVVASIANRGGEGDPSPPLQAVLAVAQRYAAAK